jgi:6,7-dimethyl-8-ribityllumazine synthase
MSTDKPSPALSPESATKKRFAIVAARFNQTIVDRLVEGAQKVLRESAAAAVEEFRCPGSLELAGLARRVAATGRFDALICIGVVIRGETAHFDLVARNAVAGIARIADEGHLAVANCIIACDHIQQALDRAGGKDGNRGEDAARVAIEMATLYQQLAASNKSRAGFGA